MVSFCLCHWSQILTKYIFSDLPERTWFKVVIFGQMGVDRCRRLWRWRCFLVLIGIVGFAMTISASDSDNKQEQLVSRIAFGSCSNQSAPQVSIFSLSFSFVLFHSIMFCPVSVFSSYPCCSVVYWNWYANDSLSLFQPWCPNSCTNMLFLIKMLRQLLSKFQFCTQHRKKKFNNTVKKICFVNNYLNSVFFVHF